MSGDLVQGAIGGDQFSKRVEGHDQCTFWTFEKPIYSSKELRGVFEAYTKCLLLSVELLGRLGPARLPPC